MQDRLVDRTDPQLDSAGVLDFLGKRDLVPRKARLAHIHGRDQRPVTLPAGQQPGPRFQYQSALSGFLEQ